jgi:hypothetical protein
MFRDRLHPVTKRDSELLSAGRVPRDDRIFFSVMFPTSHSQWRENRFPTGFVGSLRVRLNKIMIFDVSEHF